MPLEVLFDDVTNHSGDVFERIDAMYAVALSYGSVKPKRVLVAARLTEGLKLITIADISNFRKSYDSTKIIPVTEFSNVLTRALRKEELSDDNALLVIDPYSAIDTKLRDIGFEDDYTGCLVRAIRGTHLDTRYLRNIEESIPKEIGEHYKETLELIRKFDPTYGYDLATIMEKNMPPSFCSPGNRGIGGVAV